MSHTGQARRMVIIMKLTDLLIRPRQHILESDVAYVLRLAEKNASDFRILAKNLLVCVHSAKGFSYRLVSQKLNISDLEYLSKFGPKYPIRHICSECVSKNMPDFYSTFDPYLLEFCILHPARIINRCPKCRMKIRYFSGSYSLCRCGFQWMPFEDYSFDKEDYETFKQSLRSVIKKADVSESDLTPKVLTSVAKKFDSDMRKKISKLYSTY